MARRWGLRALHFLTSEGATMWTALPCSIRHLPLPSSARRASRALAAASLYCIYTHHATPVNRCQSNGVHLHSDHVDAIMGAHTLTL